MRKLLVKDKIDISELKVVVIDDADIFFDSAREKEEFIDCSKMFTSKPQFLLFSATFTEDVWESIKDFVEEAR